MENLILHRIVIETQSGVSFDIEAEKGIGEVMDVIPNSDGITYLEKEVDSRVLNGSNLPPVQWNEDGGLFEKLQLLEETSYFIDVSVPVALEVAREHAKNSNCWPFGERLRSVFLRDPVRRWREASVDGAKITTIPGQLNIRSWAGILNLAHVFGEGIKCEVLCKKIGYHDDFRYLLEAISHEAVGLLFDYGSPVSLQFSLEDEASRFSGIYFVYRWLMSEINLPAAIYHIVSAPYSTLIRDEQSVLSSEVEDPDVESIISDIDSQEFVEGGPLQHIFNGFTPVNLNTSIEVETFDVPENQFVKRFLSDSVALLNNLEKTMVESGKTIAGGECRRWRIRIEELLSAGFWGDITESGRSPGNSQVMFRKSGYREVFRFSFITQLAMSLSWDKGDLASDGLEGDIRPVSELYEYWCFLTLRRALRELCVVGDESEIVDLREDGVFVNLKKGVKSKSAYTYDHDGEILHLFLFYNPTFKRSDQADGIWSGSYTSGFSPDFSLQVTRPSDNSQNWLHFDSKYRLDFRQAESLFDAEELNENTSYVNELSKVHKKEDLYKMHTYRDGILGSRGAYVLFPGDPNGYEYQGSSKLFIRYPGSGRGEELSHKIPSVGIVSLSPKRYEIEPEGMIDLLRCILSSIAENQAYHEEKGFFDH